MLLLISISDKIKEKAWSDDVSYHYHQERSALGNKNRKANNSAFKKFLKKFQFRQNKIKVILFLSHSSLNIKNQEKTLQGEKIYDAI